MIKKTSLFLTLLVLVSCSSKTEEINFPELIGKHKSDTEITELFKLLGNDHTYVEAYDMHYYGYKELGIELNFSNKDSLRTIYFSGTPKYLPYDLQMHYTRENVENILGKPDMYKTKISNLVSYYPEKKLIIRYKNKDSVSMINPIKKILITNIELDKITSFKHPEIKEAD